jgi:hypothetical protein
MPHRVILYTKPGCHLCDLAHQLLLGLQREFDLTIQPVDICSDPALRERYWDKIPVLLIDDHTTIAAPIRTADIRAALQKDSRERNSIAPLSKD